MAAEGILTDLFKDEKFHGTNYFEGKRKVGYVLHDEDLVPLVAEAPSSEPKGNAAQATLDAFATWVSKNRIAINILFATMTETYVRGYKVCWTAKEIMDRFKKVYDTPSQNRKGLVMK
ncbi:hypothetical protein AMTR_s00005p00178240 [Amborella trichopoda]|uniref:Uncharacterized protein n=1 Tax=Amborella trichopoda TaxID=13333 RepID=W1PGM9_AMBTC|nr:hypothetical protein AMTR_s00005p00178240 [Amborella trichopoda]